MDTPDDAFKTRVDLGDDLLQAVERAKPVIKKDVVPDGPLDIPDALKSAQILLTEGFVAEAKKTLRRILTRPLNVTAKTRLQKIFDEEVKKLLWTEDSTQSLSLTVLMGLRVPKVCRVPPLWQRSIRFCAS